MKLIFNKGNNNASKENLKKIVVMYYNHIMIS